MDYLNTVKKHLRENLWQWALMAIGLIGGFLYWHFIGCLSGTCPLQSAWYFSTLWGGLLGWFLGGAISGKGCGCSGDHCER